MREFKAKKLVRTLTARISNISLKIKGENVRIDLKTCEKAKAKFRKLFVWILVIS